MTGSIVPSSGYVAREISWLPYQLPSVVRPWE
jgi:hypothetical protein